jgi:hypothetical protein
LYKKLNAKGAIVAEFVMYTTESKDLNSNVEFYKLPGTINSNYLKKFPIYDYKERRISISEKNKNWILLIPYKFKNKEKEIEQYYQSWKDKDTDKNNKVGELEIIWIKSNQEYFSYNVNVNPK